MLTWVRAALICYRIYCWPLKYKVHPKFPGKLTQEGYRPVAGSEADVVAKGVGSNLILQRYTLTNKVALITGACPPCLPSPSQANRLQPFS